MANELQIKLDAILEDKNTNLKPENLKAGVTCLGVEGVLTEAPTGTDELVATEGVLVSKELKNNDEDIPVLSTSAVFSYGEPTVVNAGGKFTTQISQATIASLAGVTADKIVSGNTILGIEGTAEGGTTGETPRADYIVKGKVVNGVTGTNYGFTPPECPSTLSVFGKADSTTGMPETITLTGYTPISWQGNSVTVEKTITEVFNECRYVAGTILITAGDPMNWTEEPPEGVYTISLSLLFKQTPFGQLDYSNNYLMIEGYQMDMQKDTYYSLSVMKTYYDTTLEQVKTDYMEQFLASYDTDYSMIYTFWDPESEFMQGHQLEENEVAYSNYTSDELYNY